MPNSRTKVGQPINTRIDLLVALLDGPKTAPDLGVTNNPLNYLMNTHGVVTTVVKGGVEQTVKHTDENGNVGRGRPAKLWRLTDKGRKRAKRAKAERETAAA
jgi:predicted ArsR family transcriptional regulator